METIEEQPRPSWTSWAWPTAFALVTVLFSLLPMLPGGEAFNRPMVLAAYLAVFVLLVAGVLVWAFLRTRRQRHHYEQRLERWTHERAVQQERLRIARDLHDLASHGLGTMTVRAATAKLTDDQDERLLALDDIERIGRASTAELRRMLSILRDPEARSNAPMRPADTLEQLPGIIDTARRAGIDVTVERGDLGEVPAGLQVTICAIVREALANTARHAGATTARIILSRHAGGIQVDVRDDGPSPGWRPTPGAGYGLAGLRERVELHDGTLTSGPYAKGFRVTADLFEDKTP